MFPLLETAIGFVAIMLMISLLVKSLTELIKDHFDFYCDNLNYEADLFLRSVVKKSLAELKTDAAVLEKAPWLRDFDLSRIGEEFFNEDNIKPLLLAVRPDLDQAVLANIKGLLAAHVSRVKYMFTQRLKNLSFAVGVGLCLVLNEKTADQMAAADREAELAEARAQFGERVKSFTSEVNFGVGRVWRQTPPLPTKASWIYEFLGALMSGLLVSVGAPYWHDILESFGSLRKSANV